MSQGFVARPVSFHLAAHPAGEHNLEPKALEMGFEEPLLCPHKLAAAHAAMVLLMLDAREHPTVLTSRGDVPFGNIGRSKAALDAGIATAQGSPIAQWRLHDLRRTVATGLQRLGVRLEVIETVLGHVSGSRAGIVGIYQRHRFEDEARVALTAWGDHVQRLLDGTTSSAEVVPLRRA